MSLIIFAIINSILSAVYHIRWKKLRLLDLDPRSAMGLFCFALPLWLVGLFYSISNGALIFSWKYLFLISTWAILVVINLLSSLYMIKFFPLSELNTFKFAFSTLMGILMDLFIFKTTFHIFTVISIVLFFASGLLLSKGKSSKSKAEVKLSTLLLVLLGLSIIGFVQVTIYKIAVVMQPNNFAHACVVQTLLYSGYIIYAFKYIKQDIKKRIITKLDIGYFSITIFFFTIFEAYLFDKLPVVLMILLSSLTLGMFAIYDMWTKDIKVSFKVLVGILFGALALFLLYLSNIF